MQKKSSEFDGKVVWEAYPVHFEMLAAVECWSRPECTLQLVSNLRKSALEVFMHLILAWCIPVWW